MEEKKITHEGLVIQSFPNGMFHVRLDDNEKVILGYISGKIRRSSIRILVGDRVKIEVSPYDATKGRIIYRFPRDKSYDSDDYSDD
uniref:Translation initiation factor IF-1, chloroplastic n=1 Tax=Ferocactus latispinus TaxID=130125 RepID=A0A8A6L3C5_9CARY|nr:translational initiation factor 1 [Ferocactus latispinus]